MIKKRKIALVLVLMCILICLNTFDYTPLANISKLLGIFLSTLGLGLFIFHFRKFPKAIRIFGILFLILFLSSVLSTHYIHGQSLKKGFLASINIYLIGMSFLVYYLIIKFKISSLEIKNKILLIGWVLLAVYIVVFAIDVRFYLVPGEEGFGIESLNKSFTTLASIFYLTDFFKKNNSKYLLFSIVLFSTYQFADFQRYITLVYIVCFLALLVQFGKKKVVVKTMISLAIIIPSVIVILTTTELGATIQQKMTDAMEIFEEDREKFTDSSMEARVWQSDAAIKSILEHPITGVGRIHNSETEKIMEISYFYVSDIGILGLMFSYGILGIFILFRQIRYLYKGIQQKDEQGKVQLMEYKYFILFIILLTIMNGRSINFSQEFMIILTLIEIGRIHYSAEQKMLYAES